MKILLALLVASLVGCATRVPPHQHVADLLKAQHYFNGRSVRVCGWFVVDMETCTLSQEVSSPGFEDEEKTIWVTPKSDVCMPVNWFRNPQARWVVVDGTFYTGARYGHLGMFLHSLVGGTVTPIRGQCQTP